MRALSILLALALCFSLGGCDISGELENQAYVLVLGVDRLADGRLELCARVPRIGGSGDGGEKRGASGGDYLMFSASGSDYAQALEALQWATPRELNLSHIELLVASESLAREPDFGELMDQIAQTPHLYTTARFVICEGSAGGFIEAQQTVIGTRLSSDISAMLDHYADHGYIPFATLADAYYAGASIYSDPVAIWGRSVEEASDVQALTQADSPRDDAVSSPMRQRFAGAALLRNGAMVGALDADQTQLLCLARGELKSLSYDLDGAPFEMTPDGPARRTALVDEDTLRLGLEISLTSPDNILDADAARMAESICRGLEALVGRCQSLVVDPFGFAEAASGRFASVPQWLDYGWRDHWQKAEIEIAVAIDGFVCYNHFSA